MVNWTDYSKTYDLLLEYNPAYQEIVADFNTFLDSQPEPSCVLDIGAGTGNYSLEILKRYPSCTVHLVEPDKGMAETAKAKLENYPNATVISSPISELNWHEYDLVVAVHSLYVVPEYELVIENIASTLKKTNGSGYLCDIGRILDVADWRKYIARSIFKKHGLAKTISILWRGKVIAKENFHIRDRQIAGEYWTHTSTEFQDLLIKNSLDIRDFTKTYRDYSDRAIVRTASSE